MSVLKEYYFSQIRNLDAAQKQIYDRFISYNGIKTMCQKAIIACLIVEGEIDFRDIRKKHNNIVKAFQKLIKDKHLIVNSSLKYELKKY